MSGYDGWDRFGQERDPSPWRGWARQNCVDTVVVGSIPRQPFVSQQAMCAKS